jgi:hypothetical protein
MAGKQHAELGASVAKRWLNCPGSVMLIRTVPKADESASNSSSYAAEGTSAHALAEWALLNDQPCEARIGDEIAGSVVTEEMALYAQVYVDECVRLKKLCGPGNWWVERKFSLEAMSPPGPMFGTADFVAYDPQTRTLYVVDLKFGQGVLVEVINNPQLRYYGLGGLLSMDTSEFPVNFVSVTIVQPRMQHSDGVVRTEKLTAFELVDFAGELLGAARLALQPDAPLKAGEWCRFCPASAICPEQREHAMALAQVDFAVPVEEFVPPAPATLDFANFAAMLSKLDILENWIRAMRAHGEEQLRNGVDVPGFKMVEKRPRRQWVDEEQARTFLAQLGFKPEQFNEAPVLRSVAQIEKLVGKKRFKESALVGVSEKVSTGLAMVPDTDSRPPVFLTAGHEFPLLPPGDSNPQDAPQE